MHIKSLLQGLNVNLAQPGLEPGPPYPEAKSTLDHDASNQRTYAVLSENALPFRFWPLDNANSIFIRHFRTITALKGRWNFPQILSGD